MRRFFGSFAMIGLTALPAGAADVTVRLNATPLPRYVQAEVYRDYYTYPPACPARYYYTCRADAIGNQHCACWPGLAYYIFRY
jgi:hypothetical protein